MICPNSLRDISALKQTMQNFVVRLLSKSCYINSTIGKAKVKQQITMGSCSLWYDIFVLVSLRLFDVN